MMQIFGYYRNDDSGGPILIGLLVIAAICWIWGAITSSIQRKAEEIAEHAIVMRKSEIDELAAKRKAEIDDQLRRTNLQCEENQKKSLSLISAKQKMLEEARTEFSLGFIAGRRWLANLVGEAESVYDDQTESLLRIKSRPAVKAAEEVKAANQRKRAALKNVKFLEYQLASYKEYFPILEEYEEIILDEIAGFRRGNEIDDPDESIDRSALYLSKEDYQRLPASERNQRALDSYMVRSKTPWEVGRLYERYLGHLYELDGWDVNFHGALKGFEDMGRDLICTKAKTTHVVQAKCWSQDKVIHEKHLFQLYGTCLLYEIMEQRPVTAVFAATTNLSDVATLAAKRLKIQVRLQKLVREYPVIKCNINQGNRIYHLPFDQQYDRVKIRGNEGEFYALTVAEAEERISAGETLPS